MQICFLKNTLKLWPYLLIITQQSYLDGKISFMIRANVSLTNHAARSLLSTSQNTSKLFQKQKVCQICVFWFASNSLTIVPTGQLQLQSYPYPTSIYFPFQPYIPFLKILQQFPFFFSQVSVKSPFQAKSCKPQLLSLKTLTLAIATPRPSECPLPAKASTFFPGTASTFKLALWMSQSQGLAYMICFSFQKTSIQALQKQVLSVTAQSNCIESLLEQMGFFWRVRQLATIQKTYINNISLIFNITWSKQQLLASNTYKNIRLLRYFRRKGQMRMNFGEIEVK